MKHLLCLPVHLLHDWYVQRYANAQCTSHSTHYITVNLNILLILENGPWGTLYINSNTDKGAHLIAALIHRSLGFIVAGACLPCAIYPHHMHSCNELQQFKQAK